MKHFSEISATAERVVDAAESLIQERGYNGFRMMMWRSWSASKSRASTIILQPRAS